MEHFFELLITVMIAVLGSNGLWAYIQSVSKTKTAKDRMLLGLGHAEIFSTAEKYIEKYLYKPYKEMGGNGTAETIMHKCHSLQIITADEAARRDKEL